jgi:hypothetical protein
VFGGRGTKGVKFLKTGEKKDFEVWKKWEPLNGVRGF